MKLKQLWSPSKAIRPAKITLRNIWAVIQSIFRRSKLLGGFKLPAHIYEQVIWRRIEVARLSPMCWQSGECIVCGCEILGKTIEDRGCSRSEHEDLKRGKQPCYPDMMDEDGWNEFKKLNRIKLFD